MTHRERGRLFAAAGLLVAGAALPLMLFGQGHATAPTDREPATTGPAAPVVRGVGREDRRPGRARHRVRTPGERAAREDRSGRSLVAQRRLKRAAAAASVFVSALLRRETGDGGPRTRRVIARRGTTDFARFVLAREPRVPAARDGPGRARLVDLEPVGLSHGRAELAATVERDGVRSGLLVALVRREERWRVAGLR
jgi:hypothetical protein